jgi:hypothetical protein
MATIINPTPVTPQTFDGMWIQSLNIHPATEGNPKGFLQSKLLPYDGKNLLVHGGKDVRKPLPDRDSKTNAMVDALVAEVQRLSGKTEKIINISVSAFDPSKPVKAFARFEGGKFHIIEDCFALAAEDSNFAGVLNLTLAEIARLAELEIVQ